MMQNNLTVAVTGGIGSGKSAVCSFLKEAGAEVFSCDLIYRELLQDGKFLNKLAEEFDGIILPDGTLDKNKLSETVFADKQKLARLNAITHPAIMEEVLKRTTNLKLSFCEVPLLFEDGLEKNFDAVLVVLRDKEQRINSVIARDGISRNQAILRINSQYDYENSNFAQYYAIHNNGKIDDLKQKTLQIYAKIKAEL